MSTSEIVRAFFNVVEPSDAGGDIHIDVLDSWTNSGLAAVSPTTISWADGKPAAV